MSLECQQGKEGLRSDDNKELVTFQQELIEAVWRAEGKVCLFCDVFFIHEGKRKR